MSPPSILIVFLAGWAQMLLYGCNIVLFGHGILLVYRRRGWSSAFTLISATVLFVLATTLVIVETALVVNQLAQINRLVEWALKVVSLMDSETPPLPGTSSTGSVGLYACNVISYVGLQVLDLVAMSILLNRCYAIYSSNWKVLIAPIILIIAVTGVYCAALPVFVKILQFTLQNVNSEDNRRLVVLSTTVGGLSVAAHSLLTLLIAGKIWIIRRRMQKLIGKGASAFHRKYDTLIAMTLESGMLMPIYLLAHIICLNTGQIVASNVLGVCIPQIMAFAPLLIMVRVGLGPTVEESHITLQADVSSHDVELQTSRPLAVSVTVSHTRTVSPSGAKGGDPNAGLASEDMKRSGCAL